jgi:hypothetical protein
MKVLAHSVLTCAVAAAVCTPVLAHHSAAAFDTQAETTITGTITEYSFRNPHVYMTLSRKLEDGTEVSTEVEAGAGSVIGPLGFTRDSVKIGDVVTIAGNPGKRDPQGLLLGKELFKEDGTYLPLNISSRTAVPESTVAATSIEGTWFSPRTSFFAFLGGARDWQTTEAGKAALASASSAPTPTPAKDCVPIGSPALMFYPVANVIDVQDDKVVMTIDWLDSVRTFYLDGRAHPPATETSLHGHSTAHWEGTTLVADTTNFSVNPIGLSTTLPSSTKKHLVERFELSADGKGMIYSGMVEDPEYLAAPIEWSGNWQYRPDMKLSNETCDLETARKFLDD